MIQFQSVGGTRLAKILSPQIVLSLSESASEYLQDEEDHEVEELGHDPLPHGRDGEDVGLGGLHKRGPHHVVVVVVDVDVEPRPGRHVDVAQPGDVQLHVVVVSGLLLLRPRLLLLGAGAGQSPRHGLVSKETLESWKLYLDLEVIVYDHLDSPAKFCTHRTAASERGKPAGARRPPGRSRPPLVPAPHPSSAAK